MVEPIKTYGIVIIIIASISACTNGNFNNEQKPIDQQVFALQKDVFIDTKLDSSGVRLKKAAKLLEQNDNVSDSLRSENDFLLGLYYNKIGVLDTASIYFHKAIDQISDSITNWRYVDYFYMAWDTYMQQNLFGDCQHIIERFEQLVKKNDYELLSRVEYFKENTYSYLGELDKALIHNEKRIIYAQKAKMPELEQSALISKSQNLYDLERKKEAYAILDGLVEISYELSIDFKRQIFGIYGYFMFSDNRYNKAIFFYKKGLESSRQLLNTPTPDAKDLVATDYSNIAEAYTKIKKYEKAQLYLDSASMLGFENFNQELHRTILIYQLDLAMQTGNDISKVTEHLDNIYEQQNQQYKTKSENELFALKAAYEKEKILTEEKQASQLQNLMLRTRFILLSIALGLIGLFGFLYYRHKQKLHNEGQLKMQQRLLRTQMNPHFTFNMLYSIKRLIKKDQNLADTYLHKFSKLLRITLDNSMANYVNLNKELEAISFYLDIQLLRMHDKFSYLIELEGIKTDDPIFIPPMLMQPIIENSIEHGISTIDYPGRIIIKLKKNKTWIDCTIEDNGVGLVKSKDLQKRSVSIGLISDFLKKSTKEGIHILDKEHLNNKETGVRTTLKIPYKISKYD